MEISKNTLEIVDVTDAAFKASLRDPALFIELVRAVIPELKGMGDDDIRERLDLEDNLVMGLDKELKNIQGFGINADMFFRVRISEEEDPIRYHFLLVEGQGSPYPKRRMEIRRSFSMAFLVTYQKGSVFTGNEYEKAMPATCTWIMFNPSPKVRNTMKVERYTDGLFRSVVLNLGDPDKEDSERILRILSTVYNRKMDAEQKATYLSDKLNIEVSDYLKEEMERMNPFQEWHDYDVQVAAEENLAKGERIGIEKGERIGEIKAYLTIVKYHMKNGMSAEEAAEHAGIPEDMRPTVISALDDPGYTAR